MKNEFLITAALVALSSCASNIDKNHNSMQPTPIEIKKDAHADAVIRTTIDPQPEINQSINNINRNAGAVISIPKN